MGVGFPVVLAPVVMRSLLAGSGSTPMMTCSTRHRDSSRACHCSHLVRRPVDRVHVHSGVQCGQFRAMFYMESDCLIAQILNEVRFPVPLQARRIEPVEHALQYRKRHGREKFRRREAGSSGAVRESHSTLPTFRCSTIPGHTSS
jgi:hypothetical protein